MRRLSSHTWRISSNNVRDTLAKVFYYSVLRLQPWANRQDAQFFAIVTDIYNGEKS
jgi:hypothetical protein